MGQTDAGYSPLLVFIVKKQADRIPREDAVSLF